MRELSLFTGAGGGVLGTTLLGFDHVGYVEFNDYCQRILQQRIKDGNLQDAPIFGDIRSFIDQGYARSYSGMVDVVTAGFPCQPFSTAGKQAGAGDERNMWPATIEVIRQVGPRFAFLENVPGIVRFDYFGEILGDLADAGFNAEWGIVSAAAVGANHIRKRLWIMAYTESERHIERREAGNIPQENGKSNIQLLRKPCRSSKCNGKGAYPVGSLLQGTKRKKVQGKTREPQSTRCDLPHWWETEPNVGRVADGVASGVDRLRAIGNGQVPAVAATAWKLLTKRISEK